LNSLVIIGSGNAATSLGKALSKAGHKVVGVFSPDPGHAGALASLLGSQVFATLQGLPADADYYLLAVKDSAIEEVSARLNVKGVVVHCSGMTAMNVLQKHDRHGVMWPLQSLTRDMIPERNALPLCVEGSDENTARMIAALASSISDKVIPMSSEQRMYAHVAAVFANNFTNHLFDVAGTILNAHDLDFDLLRPIIAETARKVQDALPSAMQTGPAARHDEGTMVRHLGLLKDHPEYARIYEEISSSISSKFIK
jgi:predicted short-subunit dehydrogenase-like oxidoreductase (DUF2520 family)